MRGYRVFKNYRDEKEDVVVWAIILAGDGMIGLIPSSLILRPPDG
jgi:hypothetical protein